jgi:hypothetical protein
MTDFGDSEPEDAWDADDPIPEQLDNILRRLILLRDSVGAVATQREQLRFADTIADLRTVIRRVVTDG